MLQPTVGSLRSALGDPNPHLNLIAMLGIYMGSELEGLEELIVKQNSIN